MLAGDRIMPRILIIDDDISIGETLCQIMNRLGYQAAHVRTLGDGLKTAQAQAIDVILLDVNMPDGSGLDILPQLRATDSNPEVIIITGLGTPDGAELAITNGAWDYVEKPISLDAVTLPLIRALQYRAEKRARKSRVALKREGIIGDSPKLRACLDLLAQAADSEAPVLITGETGTGKELLAWALHHNSSRASKSFVVLDCATLPATLVESMLFGHEKGAFTGADKAQDGLIKQADGGTLFMDEVGELPLPSQRAFLRVLQERRFRPIGARLEISSDFRMVAATNRNLDEMVKNGQFREDLLFRLKSFVIELPPLRERLEDLRELSIHYVARLCHYYGTDTKGFSPEFFAAIEAYHWPGNVRELFNTLERTVAMARHEPILYPYHLPNHIRALIARAAVRGVAIDAASHLIGPASGSTSAESNEGPDAPRLPSPAGAVPGSLPTLQEHRATMDRQYLQSLMKATGGDIRTACKVAQLSRSSLYGLLKKHSVPYRD
jgi:two-component system NtrC family response regulator